jgi:hypothetical protein
MTLKRLLEEGRALEAQSLRAGSPAWKERRVAFMRAEMASALPKQDWADLGLDPFTALHNPEDVDVSAVYVIGPQRIAAVFTNRGLAISYDGAVPMRAVTNLHAHHPFENHNYLVRWLADIFPTTPEESRG